MSYIKKEWKVKDFQKGDLEFVKSLNHMEEGIASAGPGGEPDEYIKRAEADGNKLTLTKKDDSQVIFEPQGGSEPTAYIKDAAVQDEKLTLTKKDGSLVELDVSTKLDKPVEPVAGEGINVPYYFDVEYHEADAIVRDYTIDLLDNTKAPQQFALRITAASAQQAGLLQAGDKFKLDTLNQVEANPTLIGEEQDLTGIQIGENKFKIPTGGSGEPAAYIKDATIQDEKLTLTKKDSSLVELDISVKANQTDLDFEKNARVLADEALQESIGLKQDTLVSGTNIKTINNQAILGAGNIEIQGISDYDQLSNLPIINVDLNAEDFVPVSGYYYRHIGVDGVYSNKIIYRCASTNPITYTRLATKSDIDKKQDKLTAGPGIDLTDNTVSTNAPTIIVSYDKIDFGEFDPLDPDPAKIGTVKFVPSTEDKAILDNEKYEVIKIDLISDPLISTIKTLLSVDYDYAWFKRGGIQSLLNTKGTKIAEVYQFDVNWVSFQHDKGLTPVTFGLNTCLYFKTASSGLKDWNGKVAIRAYGVPEDLEATLESLQANKQDKLTAGTNITIDENNVISAVAGGGNVDSVTVGGEKLLPYEKDVKIVLGNSLVYNDQEPGLGYKNLHVNFKSTHGLEVDGTNGLKVKVNKDSGTISLDANGLKVADNKFVKVPVEPVTGQGVNVPYYFDVNYAADKVTVKDYTIDLLDTSIAPKQFGLDINGATSTTAGLMTADEFNKVANIEALIPSQASTTNQLADKDFVNSTVQTSTATFRGNFATKADLDAYAGEKKVNDYAVVQADETHSNQSWRYKYDGSEWKAEYKLNDTAFTAKQWAAINSEVTSDKVSSYDAHIANVDIHVTADQKNTWDAKQDVITDIADIRAKANSAVQPAAISGMATETWVKNQGYLTQHQDISGKLDKPAEPVAGQGINIPYYFDVTYDITKATVRDYTIDLLDNSKSPKQFSIDINSATQSTAGLMSAFDKKAVDEMLPAYPTDTDAEYILAIKYENGAWKKYWKETVNKSDIVDSGMADYMVLKI